MVGSPTFAERLRQAAAASGSMLCVGLDPDIRDYPDAAAAEQLCLRVIEETLPYACAYKPNCAFFEQHGSAGWAVLERLREQVPRDRMLIADGKRGDIGNTAEAYAHALLDHLDADAATVNPLMGHDAVEPFVTRPGKGAFLVARSSNPGATDLLEQPVGEGREALYERITRLALSWDPGGAVGLVVGATAAAAIASVRLAASNLPLLVPGVGAQGGSLEDAVVAGLDTAGGGLLISVSRGIAAAPEGAREAARRLSERIAAVRAGRAA
jgi:orotidine-5'-phosphate decarboxylase